MRVRVDHAAHLGRARARVRVRVDHAAHLGRARARVRVRGRVDHAARLADGLVRDALDLGSSK